MREFQIKIPRYIEDIIAALNSGGYEAYVVGGCVRDSILKIPVNDWDVCSSAEPSEVKACLSGFKIVETGIKHGTVTAVKDGNVCEITTFRDDGAYTDHRRPDSVEFTKNIENDLKRRDFTINAMAYSPVRGFVDLFDGLGDLDKNIIRCVGNAETRFDEDALRIMRALRFASKLGFSIEDETSSAIKSCAGLLSCVARERINHELCGLLLGKHPQCALLNYEDVFKTVFRNSKMFSGWTEIVKTISHSKPILSLRLALLLDNDTDSYAEKLLRELKFDKKTIAAVLFILKNRNFSPDCDEIFLKKSLSKFGTESLTLLLYRYSAKNPEEEIVSDVHKKLEDILKTAPALRVSDLEIDGTELLNLGVSEGKMIREMLDCALEATLSNEVENNKEKLLEFLVTNRYKSFFENM